VVLLLRGHFERWSGGDLDLLEAFEEEADEGGVELMAGS
jgi:predicted glycosyl hydrolase (DUF1957 family)